MGLVIACLSCWLLLFSWFYVSDELEKLESIFTQWHYPRTLLFVNCLLADFNLRFLFKKKVRGEMSAQNVGT